MINTASLKITPAILSLVAEIDEFKGAWRALSTLSPERLAALRQVATIESIGSSTRIEGSQLSDREVERLLSGLEIKALATRDEQEVAGYAGVMQTVFESWPDIPMTENHIRQLHRDLLRYSQKDDRHRGHYKTVPNSVAAFDADGWQVGIIFETATPFETPQQMTELVEWYRGARVEQANGERGKGGKGERSWYRGAREAQSLHPLLVIGIFVVVFLAIHPFQDGNGRLSRILTTLLLLQAGYAYVPYSSLESVIEQSKEAYYLALRQTQATLRSEAPNWEPWLLFFLTALQRQAQRLLTKVERERLLLTNLPELSAQILDYVRGHGRLTIGQAVTLTGASRNTLKTHFRQLVERGLLTLHGHGRGAWFSLP